VKGCASFAAVFFLGVGLVIGGFVYDSMQSGLPFQEERASERQGLVARVLEVAGVAVSFGAIFGAAGWRFYRRERDPDSER
jgi:hypothetical protein